MASQRRLARRRNVAKKSMKTALRTSQNVYHKLILHKDFEFDVNSDVIIGYNNGINGDCEIGFNLFKPNDELCDISFDDITYYRTNNKILWNKRSRIDILFNSGDTKLKLKQNPNIIDISFTNYNNLPSFVKKLLFLNKMQSQLTDLLLGLQLKMTSLIIQNNIKYESKLNDDNDIDLETKIDTVITPKHSERFNYFFSIRIHNPLLIKLGTELQNEIVDEYKKHKLEIKTSLIKPIKFHISMNVISISREQDLDKFCKKLKLIQRWLKIFIFDKTNDDKKVLIGDDGVFMDMIEKYDYFNKLKKIYDEILSKKTKDIKGLRLYLEGSNHFNQNVIFLDFKNKCIVPSNMNIDYNKQSKMKWKPTKKGKMIKQETSKGTRNDLIVKLIQIYYELIRNLCKTYNIPTNDESFIPHCTIMKLSKLKGIEMKKFLKYNKMNKIKLMIGHNHLGNNKERRRRERGNKVYDFNILSAVLNQENIEKKIKSMILDKNKMDLFENIKEIDFCAMRHSYLTKDGYYNVIHSLPIVP